jgi:hypothetical protein
MKHNLLIYTLLALIINTGLVNAQQGTVKGLINSSQTGVALAGAAVTDAAGKVLAITEADGSFTLDLPEGKQTLFINLADFDQAAVEVTVKSGETTDTGLTSLTPSAGSMLDMPTINISEGGGEDGFETQSIQGILSASADAFLSTAAYTFGPTMFKVRGYESNYSNVSLNGFVMNDIESGSPYFSNWGGLNDVMRNAQVTSGPEPIGFLFEPVGGATRINTMASEYRRGLKAVYSLSNRTYRNRLMLTYSTGLMKNNWAFTGSYSRRWSERGYEQGTFYDGNSFFISAEKIFNSHHSLNFTALDAIYQRGVAGGSTQEVYDLMKDNNYNPYWGYQNGKVRNSRVRSNNRPLFTLNHTWTVSDKLNIQTTTGYWFGKSGYTALNWQDPKDPRPDYYKNLPSNALGNDDEVARITEAWQTDPTVSHVDWDHFYFTNRNNLATVQDASGISGNNITGHESQYIVEDRRNDISQFQFNTRTSWEASEKLNITGGLLVDLYEGHNFNTVKDLLGGDFWFDYDKYAEGLSNPYNLDQEYLNVQNDLNNPNHVAHKGDIIGNNYKSFQRGATLWGTARFTNKRYSLYLGANVRYTSMWRQGLFRKGLFPDNSYGNSKKLDYLTWGVKAGGDYRINGRHMVTFNTLICTNPPLFRNSFLSPRTRNSVTNDLQEETIISGDISYVLRTPVVKGRLTAYYTRFMNQTDVTSFYYDDKNTLVNFATTNIDKENYGLEMGADITIATGLTINTAASLGQFLWINNPDITVTQDNSTAVLQESDIWIKYFRQSGTPQTALSLGLEYNSSNFWWVGITGSYYDNIYLDFNPVTRAKNDQGYYPNWQKQIKEDPNFLVDMFIGKSWKVKNIYLNVSANLSNVLNNKNMVTGGYEQYRFSSSYVFDPKIYYYNGFNYFINFSIRM